MSNRIRSMSGGAMMLVIIPVLAGLLACMPEVAPIGNPERARIDPELNGVWVLEAEDEGAYAFYFEPYDKRTWLMFGLTPESVDEEVIDDESMASYEGLVNGLRARNAEGAAVVAVDEVSVYKAWLTRISGETFLVWQIKGAMQEDGSWGEAFAYNWRMTRPDADTLVLQFINMSDDYFEDVDFQDRKAIERVIRRHADEEEFFDEEVFSFVRAAPEDLPEFRGLLRNIVSDLE